MLCMQAQQHPWMTNSPFSTETFYTSVRRQLSTTKFSSANPVHDSAADGRVMPAPTSQPAVPKKRRRAPLSTRPAVPLALIHLDNTSPKRPENPGIENGRRSRREGIGPNEYIPGVTRC